MHGVQNVEKSFLECAKNAATLLRIEIMQVVLGFLKLQNSLLQIKYRAGLVAYAGAVGGAPVPLYFLSSDFSLRMILRTSVLPVPDSL